jgi:serine/threonine-protein kinase SRPK3
LIKDFKYEGVPINIIKPLVRNICEGLDFLHRECKVIHTDLKPENVLLCEPLAQIIEEKMSRRHTMIMGSSKRNNDASEFDLSLDLEGMNLCVDEVVDEEGDYEEDEEKVAEEKKRVEEDDDVSVQDITIESTSPRYHSAPPAIGASRSSLKSPVVAAPTEEEEVDDNDDEEEGEVPLTGMSYSVILFSHRFPN